MVITKDFIAVDVTQAEAAEFMEKASTDESGELILYTEIDEITSTQESVEIDIGTRKAEGYKIHTITLQNLIDRDTCIDSIYSQLSPDFARTVQKQKLFDALLLPAICLIIVLVVGGFTTWFFQLAQEPVQRTHIVKAWVYYAHSIGRFIGPTPPAILTGLLSLVSLFFLVKKLFVRPLVITLEKTKTNVQ